MPDKFKLDYDFGEDLLYLYNENKKSRGGIEFGDLVIDLEEHGEIVGVEMFGASKYLSELTNRKITKENLRKIQRAAFSFSVKRGTIVIKIILPIDREEVPATIAIQNMHYRSPIRAFSG